MLRGRKYLPIARITYLMLVKVSNAEVIGMVKNRHTKSGTNVEQVKKQNQKAANKTPGQMKEEFAEETDVQSVKKQNQQSEQNKK